MTEANVYDVVCEIYATFGKTPPTRSSRIVSKLADKVQDIPDRVAQYIEECISRNNSLPTNLSKAFRDAWDSYCQAHPSAAGRAEKCQYCYGNGGWNYFREDWPFPFWSFCPHCTPQNEATRLTPRQLMEKGYAVVPSNYPGGVEAFRQQKILGWLADREAAPVRPTINRIQSGYMES